MNQDIVQPGQVWVRRSGRHQGAQIVIQEEVPTSLAPRRFWLARSLTAQQPYVTEYEDTILSADWKLLTEDRHAE